MTAAQHFWRNIASRRSPAKRRRTMEERKRITANRRKTPKAS
jgi:hypothetical protein